MRRFVDLHTHSVASDGSLPPEEIVRLAEAKRLAAVALTDHDTVAGLGPARKAASEFPSLQFVAGVEISARFPTGTMHIMGLGIDESSPELRETLERLRAARNQRNPKLVARLQRLKLEITMDDVLAVAKDVRGGRGGQIVGRMHIAETLRRKGYVKSAKEAFAKYIGLGCPAYVDKERLSPRQAIAAIRAAGGVAILAHPVHLNCRNRAELERVMRELIAAGLEGIEVYHTDHTVDQTRLYLELACRYHLLVTGGSDFHGAAKPEAMLGRPRVPMASLVASGLAERLFESIRAQRE